MSSGRLPAAFWAYWALLVASCALEFCLLFWAPAYLERVVGPSRLPRAATGSPRASRSACWSGGSRSRWLVARVALRRLLIAALALAFAGFLDLLGRQPAPGGDRGVFLIGLGIAPLYPLVTDFRHRCGAGR